MKDKHLEWKYPSSVETYVSSSLCSSRMVCKNFSIRSLFCCDKLAILFVLREIFWQFSCLFSDFLFLWFYTAQFFPFAALSGHGDAIREGGRLTDSFIELEEGRKEQLDVLLRLIGENLDSRPEIEVTYFQPDEKKCGWAYVTMTGRVKRIDEYSRRIVFMDGQAISIERLFSIRGEMFQNMDWLDA